MIPEIHTTQISVYNVLILFQREREKEHLFLHTYILKSHFLRCNLLPLESALTLYSLVNLTFIYACICTTRSESRKLPRVLSQLIPCRATILTSI